MLEGQPNVQRDMDKHRAADDALRLGKFNVMGMPVAWKSRRWQWTAAITASLIALATVGWMVPLGGAQAQPAATPDATPESSVACAMTPAYEDPLPDALPAVPMEAGTVEADTATAAELDLLARTVAACLSAGDSRTVASLVTEQHLSAIYVGGANLTRNEILALVADLPAVPVEIRAIEQIRLEAAGGASAEVVYVVANQLLHGHWTFVRQVIDDGSGGRNNTRWVVAAEVPLPVTPPPDAASVQVGIDEYAFDLQPATVDGPTVVLHAENDRDEDHELLVLRLEPGVTTDALLRQPGPALPDGVTFVGQTFVAAGTEASLVLVDLDPGVYALVDLLPDSVGNPHLALGMEAELTVE